MPNLENLRKQAKQYLHWHRAGDYTVSTQIRAFLPKYRHLSDKQVLEQSFKLSDAQELVAKKAGFDSWMALKKGITSMTAQTSREPGKPSLLSAEPQLFVTDLAAAIDFYTVKLGFDVRFVYGEPPFYAQVFRDHAGLNLRAVDTPAFDAGFREREGDVLSATITVEDAKALFLEYRERGVAFHQSLKLEPWGAISFIVADPSNNLILFAGSGPVPAD